MPLVADSAAGPVSQRPLVIADDMLSLLPVEERMRNDDDRTKSEPPAKSANADADRVEEASEESFPASDPPSWEPLRSGPPAGEERDRDAGAR